MRRRQLGRSGLDVSEIGFGTWGLGGTHGGAIAYGATRDDESVAALTRAHDLGCNFYDTSDLYGSGHSETLLGETFAEQRSSILIATKAGFLGPDGRQDFSLAHLDQTLNASLERLRTFHVDLFQLHSPPLELLLREPALFDWLHRLRNTGKTRAIGISTRSPEEGLAIVTKFPIDALQVNFNLVDQRALENGLLEKCAEAGVGVIVRTPLCFGFLTGVFGDQPFPEGDHRALWSPAQRQRWSEAMQIFNDLVGTHQSPAQFALRYCLSQPGVTTVIPGMLTTTHVDENLAASSMGPLPAADLAAVRELYRGQSFFVGK